MAEAERLICGSDQLQERGQGIRFALPEFGERVMGFAIRYNGRPYGYVNSCAHVPVELDWQQGDFFDLTHEYIICATHGAHYDPTTGVCRLGPCKGKSLQQLDIAEHDGNIYLRVEDHV